MKQAFKVAIALGLLIIMGVWMSFEYIKLIAGWIARVIGA